MDAIKVLLPIFTFFLGAIFTLYLRRIDARKQQIEQTITEIADLSNQWYEQLNDIRVIKDFENENHEIEKKMYLYINNRLILPKYLKNLEILEKYKHCHVIYNQAQIFLSLVTNPIEVVYSEDYSIYTSYPKHDDSFSINNRIFACLPIWNADVASDKVSDFFENGHLEEEGFIKLLALIQSHSERLDLVQSNSESSEFLSKGAIVKSERGEIVKYDDAKPFDLIMFALDKVVQTINQEAGKTL